MLKGRRPWGSKLRRNCWSALWCVVIFCRSLTALQAVIFCSTPDPNFNTAAPTGVLAASGWQWVGTWGSFQGTPIGPHHFIAARHVGGLVGDSFGFNGVSYPTIAFADDAVTDLRIWEINGTFPTWAPLYRGSTEIGSTLMVFGRGLTRGAAVVDPFKSLTRGWLWGAGDGRLRWVQNVVAEIRNEGAYWGELLYATFDQSGGASEADLASGDSSGPVFINDGTGWKLAGVAAAVDAYFSVTGNDAGFNASVFDARGLYFGSQGAWQLIPVSNPSPVASGFYATRISVRAAWIDSIVPPVDGGADAPLLGPTGSLAFAILLFGVGARFLGRHRNRAATAQ